jgi:hypothetical protein
MEESTLKIQVWTSKIYSVKRIVFGMPTGKRNVQNVNVRRFYEISKHKAAGRENKVELEINMERMGSKLLSHKIPKRGPCHHGYHLSDQPGERIESSGNGTGKSTF